MQHYLAFGGFTIIGKGLDDFVWQEDVISRQSPLPTLPIGALAGDRYLATNTGNGWIEDNIYTWSGYRWYETVCNEGMALWVQDEDTYYYYDGSDWLVLSLGGGGASGASGVSGATGDSGASGASGVSGAIGDSGASGVSGATGVSGVSGAAGDSGASGASGVAGLSGVSGVAGDSGASGVAGDSGVSGAAGDSGASGVKGDSGASGASGVKGDSGASGVSGVQGDSGVSGATGDSGYSGVSGATGDSGVSGVSGDSGVSGVAGDSGVKGDSGVSGAKGDSGVSGAIGDSGASGVTGDSGASGASGVSGATGESFIWQHDWNSSAISYEVNDVVGYNGSTWICVLAHESNGTNYPRTPYPETVLWELVAESGYSGISGVSGVKGDSGVSGATGDSGVSGASGVKGDSGASGASGVKGDSGVSGTSGTSGATGDSGFSGASGQSLGDSGYSGASGVAGESGASGVKGDSGVSGATGDSGVSGATGDSGASGASGASGVAGREGPMGAATPLNYYNPYALVQTGSSNIAISALPAIMQINTFDIYEPVLCSYIQYAQSYNWAFPAGTTSASTGTQQISYSKKVYIYTRQDYGANSTNLSVFTTCSGGWTNYFTYDNRAGSTKYSNEVRYITDSAGGTTSWSTASAGVNFTSYWTGNKIFLVPLVKLMNPGEYWIVNNEKTAIATNTSLVAATVLLHSEQHLNFVNWSAYSVGMFGGTKAGSYDGWGPMKQGWGYFSSNNGAWATNSMPLSIVSSASRSFPYAVFVNYSIPPTY